jgi:hypothetical protein
MWAILEVALVTDDVFRLWREEELERDMGPLPGGVPLPLRVMVGAPLPLAGVVVVAAVVLAGSNSGFCII